MPPLPNIRHEKFCQALFRGEPAVRAYEQAGYKVHQSSSSRLRWFAMVQDRLAELQAELAKSAKVSVQSLLNELETARQQASDLGQLSAATAAIIGKAKVSGLLVNRTEIGTPGDFDSSDTVPDVAAKIMRRLSEDHPNAEFTAEDKLQAADLFSRQMQEFQEFVDGCLARVVNPTKRLDPAVVERKRLFGSGNGRQR